MRKFILLEMNLIGQLDENWNRFTGICLKIIKFYHLKKSFAKVKFSPKASLLVIHESSWNSANFLLCGIPHPHPRKILSLKVYTWSTKKHRNGWVTLKCQKNLVKYCISLAIKASLKVKNRIQYTNHQMNNVATNQTYAKASQYIFLDWLFDMIVRNDSLAVTKARRATIIRHEKRTCKTI